MHSSWDFCWWNSRSTSDQWIERPYPDWKWRRGLHRPSATENLDNNFKNPLYSNATINLGAALSILVTFSQKFKLSGDASTALIQLINLLLPVGQIFPKSLYLFKKILGSLCPNVNYYPLFSHLFCKVCMIKLGKGTEKCINPDCFQSKTPNDSKIKKIIFHGVWHKKSN